MRHTLMSALVTPQYCILLLVALSIPRPSPRSPPLYSSFLSLKEWMNGAHSVGCSSIGSYLRQVVDVRVLHLIQGVHGPSECVDLLMRITDQDLTAVLRQHHVHDDWQQRVKDKGWGPLRSVSPKQAGDGEGGGCASFYPDCNPEPRRSWWRRTGQTTGAWGLGVATALGNLWTEEIWPLCRRDSAENVQPGRWIGNGTVVGHVVGVFLFLTKVLHFVPDVFGIADKQLQERKFQFQWKKNAPFKFRVTALAFCIDLHDNQFYETMLLKALRSSVQSSRCAEQACGHSSV